MKPYQKKYKRKEGKKNTRWTDADREVLRALYEQGASYKSMADLLDRSIGGITQQLHEMKKQDAVDKYVHVREPKPDIKPYVLTDAMLEDFHLYEPVTRDAWEADNPSTWKRIKAFIKRVMRTA